MTPVPKEKLDKLVARWEALQQELSGTLDQQSFARFSKEFADLDPVVATIRGLRDKERERDDLTALLADADTDDEMRSLAEAELEELGPQIDEAGHDLRIQLLPKDAADERSAIVELRAGTGGDEAALFAADLFRM
ncbi:MAG: PCRF domain-containing protein, partial [Pseudomonadota bacterium]